MKQEKEYYAFISYKREDEKWAKWLQEKLEHYKFPTNLNGHTDLPKNIRPTFRDITDLTPGLLAEEIYNALCKSEWLIVICSPRSAKSPWVCKEAQTFIDLGRTDHIIPFVIEGIPFSDDSSTECYPEALLSLTGNKELLAANINEMGRDAAAIKVVARMFNLRFDSLWQRYERGQRRKRWMWVSGSILLALLGLTIGGFFFRQNTKLEISQSRFVAEKSEQLMKEGNTFLAMRLLLSRAHPNLIIPEIEYGLRKAYNILEEGMKPVSIIGEPFGKGSSYLTIVNIEVTKDGYKYVFTKDKMLLTVNSCNGKTIFAKTWSDDIYNVKLCNDDKFIVISDSSGKAYVLDSSDGKILFTFVVGNKLVEDIATNDNAGIISICSGNQLKVWNYNGRQVRSFSFDNDISHIKCHPNGSMVAVTNENIVELYNIKKNRIVHSMLHNGFCHEADFSSDGRLISTCSDDSIVKVWNVSDGALIRQFKLKDYVSTAIFDKTSTFVIAQSGYGSKSEISTLNIKNGNIEDVFRGQFLSRVEGEPTIIEEDESGHIKIFSPFVPNKVMDIPVNGNLIDCKLKGDKALISTTEGLTRLWYMDDNRSPKVFGHSDYTKSIFHGKYMIRDVQMNRGGNIVATVGDDNLVKFWSYPNLKEVGTFVGHSEEPHTVRFSLDEKYIVSSSYDKTAILWDVNTRHPIHVMQHEESVECAEFINNDKQIMTTSGHDVIIWSLNSGKQIKKLHAQSTTIQRKDVWEADGDDVIDAIYEEKRKQFFVSYRDGTIRIWSYAGDIIKEIKAHKERTEICYSSHLDKLISWSSNGELYVWEIPSFKKTPLLGHIDYVNDAKLLHNGYELISSDGNGIIILWDLRTCVMKRMLCSGGARIQHLRVSDNDKYLLALPDDNVLKIISISDGSLRMAYENPDFYVCPIMSKNCDAIIAPLGNGWINIYKYPKIEKLIFDIQQILHDVSLSDDERRKYLFE